MSRISSWAVRYALVLALLIAASLASTVLAPPYQAYQGHEGSVVVEIEPLTPSRVIAERLEASGGHPFLVAFHGGATYSPPDGSDGRRV